jgi:hypothetical protein
MTGSAPVSRTIALNASRGFVIPDEDGVTIVPVALIEGAETNRAFRGATAAASTSEIARPAAFGQVPSRDHWTGARSPGAPAVAIQFAGTISGDAALLVSTAEGSAVFVGTAVGFATADNMLSADAVMNVAGGTAIANADEAASADIGTPAEGATTDAESTTEAAIVAGETIANDAWTATTAGAEGEFGSGG